MEENNDAFNYKTPLQMVSEGKFLYICAPMVRYSKYVNVLFTV